MPRFVALPPASDCSAVGDCGASYFPKLFVDPVAQIQITAAANSSFQVKYIRVINQGGGLMFWNANTTYKNGAGWVRLDPPSGANNATLRIDVIPTGLAPGIYEATVTVDAGTAVGSATIPIKLTVTAAPAQPPVTPPAAQGPPAPAVSSVMNAASFSASGVVPGSLATLKGSNLAGKSVTVMFDTYPAKLLYQSDSQINLLVPAELAGRPKCTPQHHCGRTGWIANDGSAGRYRSIDLPRRHPESGQLGEQRRGSGPGGQRGADLPHRYGDT